jgi:hypothetical protein
MSKISRLWLIFNRFDLILKHYITKHLNQQEKKCLLFRKKKTNFLKKGGSTLQLQKKQLIEYKFLKFKNLWLKNWLKQFKTWLQHFLICFSVLHQFFRNKLQRLILVNLKTTQYFSKRLSILMYGIKKLNKIFYLFEKNLGFVNMIVKLIIENYNFL